MRLAGIFTSLKSARSTSVTQRAAWSDRLRCPIDSPSDVQPGQRIMDAALIPVGLGLASIFLLGYGLWLMIHRSRGDPPAAGATRDLFTTLTSIIVCSGIVMAVTYTVKGSMMLFSDASTGAALGLLASAVVLALTFMLLLHKDR